MNLSKHLTLDRVVRSDTAKRLGLDNTPTPAHLENLKAIARLIFEPLRAHFGVDLFVSSGYRSEALNAATPGASKTSQHSKGEALDLDQDEMHLGVTNREVFDYIRQNLDFDQLIWEFGTDDNPAWVHVSCKVGYNRGQVLVGVRTNGVVSYRPYKATA